jgi:hypothetical protein
MKVNAEWCEEGIGKGAVSDGTGETEDHEFNRSEWFEVRF